MHPDFTGDLHRPTFHFLPLAGWINDPNGLIQWEGEVHLFFQFNPLGPWHERIHWGHATSRDLVHWRHLPIALTPQAGEFDEGGCWSGCAVDDAGTPTLFYTGVFPQVVNRAVSRDGLLTWEKDAANPRIAGAPEPIAQQNGDDFRDPFVWREGDEWRLLIGSRTDAGGILLLYRSRDLRNWEYVGPYLVGDRHAPERPWSGTMWECPNLLRFGDRSLLVISPQSAPTSLLEPVWHSGPAGGDRFQSQKQGVLVHGHTFYAPQVTRLADGRIVMWGWLKEARPLAANIAAGWNGALSVPIEVTLDDDGAPRLAPVPELEALRRGHWTLCDLALAETPTLLDGIAGAALDMTLELEMEEGAEVGLLLRCAPDLSEQVTLWIGGHGQELSVERAHAGIEEPSLGIPVCAPLAPLAPAARRRLRVLLDHSILEVFADDGRCVLATRIYPQRADSLHVGICARSAHARVAALDVWVMAGVW